MKIDYVTNVKDGIPVSVDGYENILFVGPQSSSWSLALQRQAPGKVYNTLQGAINAAPRGDGTNTFGYNRTLILYRGQDTSATFPITIPVNRSGITIIGLEGSDISTSSDLGSGVALLKVEAFYTRLVDMTLFNTNASQAGDAIQVGSAAASGLGAGLHCKLENVRVLGPENGVYTTFKNGIVLKDAKYTLLDRCTVYVGEASVSGIKVSAGIGNSKGVILRNCHSEVTVDTTNASFPLLVDASQDFGRIEGGHFYANSTANAIEINGADWYLGDLAFAGNNSAVGAGAQIDWNGARPKVGVAYVKQFGGATAASLFTEANI